MKCKNCDNSCPDEKQKNGRKIQFCTRRCYLRWWRMEHKNKNTLSYQKRLALSKENRRRKVRIRKGLPLDYPSLLSPNWGKGWKMKDGYKQLLLKDHPNTAKSGYVMEHIVVMSKIIGRPLRKGETVHHKNGIRDDNRPENLELWADTCRQGQRVSDRIVHCKDFLESYGHTVILNEKGLIS